MYEAIEKHLREEILARPVQTLSSLEEERTQHDVFMVSRLAMGGVYVGGDDYMKRIDDHIKSQSEEESPKHLVVTGDAGRLVLFRLSFSFTLSLIETRVLFFCFLNVLFIHYLYINVYLRIPGFIDLIKKRLLRTLAIGYWGAIVWRSLKQSISSFSYEQTIASKCPITNAQSSLILRPGEEGVRASDLGPSENQAMPKATLFELGV